MSRATLGQVQLHRAHLAADFGLHGLLQRLGGARQILVPECIHRAALRRCAHKGAVGQLNALGDRDHHVGVAGKSLPQVCEERLVGESPLGQIDEIGLVTCHEAAERSGGGQPARVPSHDLHDGHGGDGVDRGIPQDLLHGHGNILGRRAEAGGVVGAHKVVVNGLGHTHDPHGIAPLLGVRRHLGDRIHGVVAADIEEIADVVLFKNIEQTSHHGVLVGRSRGGKLAAAGAQRGGRGEGETLKRGIGSVGGRGKKLVEKDDILPQESVHTVAHAVQMPNGTSVGDIGERTADDTRQRGVDGRRGAARLTDYRVAAKSRLFHIKILRFSVVFYAYILS